MGKRAVATLLLLIIVLAILLLRNSEESSGLGTLFSHEDCDKACWNGFEPFVASRDSVENWLNASGISYSVVTMGRENDTFLWYLTEESPLFDPSIEDQPRITMEFTEDRILWRTWLINIRLCANSVIDAYGTPNLIGEDRQNIWFGYPTIGLQFGFHKGDTYLSMMLTSPDWVVHFSNSDEQISWEGVQDILIDEDCQDTF